MWPIPFEVILIYGCLFAVLFIAVLMDFKTRFLDFHIIVALFVIAIIKAVFLSPAWSMTEASALVATVTVSTVLTYAKYLGFGDFLLYTALAIFAPYAGPFVLGGSLLIFAVVGTTYKYLLGRGVKDESVGKWLMSKHFSIGFAPIIVATFTLILLIHLVQLAIF